MTVSLYKLLTFVFENTQNCKNAKLIPWICYRSPVTSEVLTDSGNGGDGPRKDRKDENLHSSGVVHVVLIYSCL